DPREIPEASGDSGQEADQGPGELMSGLGADGEKGLAMPQGGARRHGVRRLCSEQAVWREFLAGWVGRI
ncbi:MAG: hypothetical protein AB1563_04530, partial [Bacillota bacterium]